MQSLSSAILYVSIFFDRKIHFNIVNLNGILAAEPARRNPEILFETAAEMTLVRKTVDPGDFLQGMPLFQHTVRRLIQTVVQLICGK